MAKTKEQIEKDALEKRNLEDNQQPQEDPNSEGNSSNEGEEDVNISTLVNELMPSYPNVPRGVIYEATMSINNEVFLANYLAEKEISNTYTEGDLTIGDLFLKNDPSELNSVLNLGSKIGLSKSMTILAAGLLGIGKTVYHVLTNDDIRNKLDDIDLNHSKKLIEKANALTNKVGEKEINHDNNNNNKKGN